MRHHGIPSHILGPDGSLFLVQCIGQVMESRCVMEPHTFGYKESKEAAYGPARVRKVIYFFLKS